MGTIAGVAASSLAVFDAGLSRSKLEAIAPAGSLAPVGANLFAKFLFIRDFSRINPLLHRAQ
jgi:hypothetical protein